MTSSLTGRHDTPGLRAGDASGPEVRTRQSWRGRMFGIRTGQLLATQIAAVALLTGLVNGPLALGVSTSFAVAVLAVTWPRRHGRWAYEWLEIAVRFAGRRHAVPAGAVLELVAPGGRIEVGDPAALIVDGVGMTAVLELGDPAGLLAEDTQALPSPVSLLPPAGAEHPPVRIQLLLMGVPAPRLRAGSGTPANSYRQLTEGRLLGHSRALLAVRVLPAEGFSDDDLRQALSSLIRKLPRRLGTIAARPLGETATRRVIAELAHDDGSTLAQEAWTGLQVGDQAQATFRLQHWPAVDTETSRRLVPRLLALPAAATTVAITVGPRAATTAAVPADLTVRLAASDAAGLGIATLALRTLLSAERAHARRLDGEHLDGLASTLPLVGGTPMELPGPTAEAVLTPALLARLELPVTVSGLMLGTNRRGDPVVARLFRPEQTRALLIGGVRCAQLITLRAMALGARVIVQTGRPEAWTPFVRGVAMPGESIAVLPPGRAVEIPPGSVLNPLLVVVDVGPVGADPRPGAAFQATLVVRDDFGAGDVDVASRADLLVLQPLSPAEATLIGVTLGLGDAAQWLTQIRADMVGVVNRRAVRWAALAQTPIESQLIGPPTRGG